MEKVLCEMFRLAEKLCRFILTYSFLVYLSRVVLT